MPTSAKLAAKTAAKTITKTPTKTRLPRKPAAKAAPAVVASKPAKKAAQADTKPAKLKVPLVRDGFTMPAADFELIAAMKLRALKLMRPTKKSELLRAGLHALTALNDTRFCATLNALTPLKPGRPKKAG